MLLFFSFHLFGVLRCYFLGPTKRRAGKSNSKHLAKSAIVMITVDLIGMDRFGIKTETLTVFFDLSNQITRLIVAVPTDLVYKTESINKA